MSIGDWLNVAAVLLSPLIALQISARLADHNEKRGRKRRIYETLMATRASTGSTGTLSLQHVNALNMIDIEFHGDKRAAGILIAWRAYLDHLNAIAPAPKDESWWNNWGERRMDLFADLLHEMSTYFGYSFDKVHLKRQAYSPSSYGDIEADAYNVRKLALELMSGARPLFVEQFVPPKVKIISPSSSAGDADQ